MRTVAENERIDLGNRLMMCFGGNVEELAEFLHQTYRAASKSFHQNSCNHGWSGCNGKPRQYFLRRAAWLLDGRGSFNGCLPKCTCVPNTSGSGSKPFHNVRKCPIHKEDDACS